MTTIDIYSGFLGAGKTTLIKKMIREGYQNEKLVPSRTNSVRSALTAASFRTQASTLPR